MDRTTRLIHNIERYCKKYTNNHYNHYLFEIKQKLENNELPIHKIRLYIDNFSDNKAKSALNDILTNLYYKSISPLKIGFDIDDTLNNVRFRAAEIFNRELSLSIETNEVLNHSNIHLYSLFGLSELKGKELWKKHQNEIYSTNIPLDSSVECLNQLFREGHQIFYITARSNTKENVLMTKEWLKTNGFPFHESRFYIGMKDEEKAKIVTDLNLDLYFDDKPSVLSVFENNKSTKPLIVKRSHTYNEHLSFPSVSDWSSIFDILDLFYEENQ